ncbi:hypothetical protein L6164_015797 [Bauhinia variegata]|uniref:Uncharacterized protein n=1 Tax=Bauhinia variegata TaxID=167791 RepID=A0ACB9NMY9_BAUVA|nr:hypothetical protein L6164_015797 [Bauhinia variegata]
MAFVNIFTAISLRSPEFSIGGQNSPHSVSYFPAGEQILNSDILKRNLLLGGWLVKPFVAKRTPASALQGAPAESCISQCSSLYTQLTNSTEIGSTHCFVSLPFLVLLIFYPLEFTRATIDDKNSEEQSSMSKIFI